MKRKIKVDKRKQIILYIRCLKDNDIFKRTISELYNKKALYGYDYLIKNGYVEYLYHFWKSNDFTYILPLSKEARKQWEKILQTF